MSGEAGKWAGRGALLGRASAVSGGALGRAGTATRERSWAEAEEGDARVRVGPRWAGSFAGPRGEREKGLGWVEFGFGFGFWVPFLFHFFFFLSSQLKTI